MGGNVYQTETHFQSGARPPRESELYYVIKRLNHSSEIRKGGFQSVIGSFGALREDC